MDKGSWDAVRFVPYKKGDSQRVSPTPAPERVGTEDTLESQDPPITQKGEVKDGEHYADLLYDEGLINIEVKEWEYYPKNNTIINHILQHCEDIPANKIKGVRAARDAMNILMKHYAVSTELEKFLVAEKL